MTCEPQPQAGDCAQASIDYGSAQNDYSIDLLVLGQTVGDDWDLGSGTPNLILDDDLGFVAPEARPVAQTFEVVEEGTTNFPVVEITDMDDPLNLEFSVTNPSSAHNLMGVGFASITMDFRYEYQGFVPTMSIYGANVPSHLLYQQPVPVRLQGLGNVTTAGFSATVAIGPNSLIEPGQTWADTISFQLQSGAEPNVMEVVNYSARVKGMIL